MKKIISIILIISLLAGCSCIAFGEDAASAAPVVITPALLEERMLTTGTAIELANIKRVQDRAVAQGNSETVKNLEQMFSSSGTTVSTSDLAAAYTTAIGGDVNNVAGVVANSVAAAAALAAASVYSASMPSDSVNLKLAQLTRDFYKKNYEKNYEASLNQIRQDAVSTFYQMLQVQEYNKIAKESLAIAQNTLDLVQKKYKLGSASKLELLSAQVDYQSALANEATAKNNYETAVMSFNLANSYPLLAEVVFEGGDTMAAAPSIELADAIKAAVANRNEVSQMHFYKDIQEVSWKHTQLVAAGSSSTYLNGKAAYLQIGMADRLIESQIELEIRQRFGDIEAKRLAAEGADQTLKLAEEAYNITQISYKLGAATLNDLRTSSNTLNQAKLGKVNAVSEYNRAVKELEFATGVGTAAISVGN